MVIIPMITGFISLVSSCTLTYLLLKKRRDSVHKKFCVSDQLICGMALADICQSMSLSWSTFPGSEYTTSKFPVRGTIRWCSFQGFLFQLGFGAPLYNCCLGIYYVLTVRYRKTDRQLLRNRVVAVMHFLAAGFALSTATAGLALRAYNPNGALTCYVNALTQPIHEDDAVGLSRKAAISPELSDLLKIIFGGFPMILSLTIVPTTMAVLYFTIQKTEKKSRRWRFSSAMSTYHSSTMTPSPVNTRQPIQSITMARKARDTGILFGAALCLMYLPASILELNVLLGGGLVHGRFEGFLKLANVTLLPLQGLFNFSIYTSSKWLPILYRTCGKYRCSCQMQSNASQIDSFPPEEVAPSETA